MNENIDLTKILKDCPIGWPLWSSVYGDVEFVEIYSEPVLSTRDYEWIGQVIHDCNHPVRFWTTNGIEHCVSSRGEMIKDHGECTLFPSREQRDWSKFTAPWYNRPIEQKFQVGQYITDGYISGQIIEDDCHCYKVLDFTGDNIIIPFTLQDNYHLWTIQDAKDGDVLVNGSNIFIFHFINNRRLMGYCHVNMDDGNLYNDIGRNECFCTIDAPITPATKEQRDRLFQRIKEAGYKWNADTKTLEKLVGHKFDPKTLKPFDKVLVRDNINNPWVCDHFSYINHANICITTDRCKYCIPYNDETKHLVGTNEEAPEYYRYWEE